MSDETKDTTAATPQAPDAEVTKETKGKTPVKPKAEPKPKAESVGALRSVGLAACKRHGLTEAWVTSDGQTFAQEGDAKAHAKNLPSKETLKVSAK